MTAAFQTLKRRPLFLRAAKGRKAVRRTLVLQCHSRDSCDDGAQGARFGFTATRKLGGAVVRNRTKRRLREAVRRLQGRFAKPMCDYVVIGRRDTATLSFDVVLRDLETALKTVSNTAERGTQ